MIAALSPAPVRAQEADPRPPSVEDPGVRLARAEENLRLYGLSFESKYLEKATEDARRAVASLPARGENELRFGASFTLALALASGDFPEDGKAREALVQEIRGSLERAAEVEPEFSGLFLVDGIVREHLGDVEPALENLDAGLAGVEAIEGLVPWKRYQLRLFGLLSRGRARIASPKGLENLADEDFEKALHLAESVRGDPDMPRGSRLRIVVLTHLAASKQAMKSYQRCEAILRTLREAEPGNSLHAYNLALVLAGQNKYGEAVAAYRKAIELAPRDPRPRLKLAYILLTFPPPGEAPDVEGALREAAAYLSISGQETDEYLGCRGEIAWHRREMAESENWFRAALAKNPDCRGALNRLIMILGREENLSEAREKELEALRARLADLTRRRSGGTMETGRPDPTFC